MEKAGLIGLVKMRYLPSDDKLSLRGGTLRAAVDEDLEAGLIPFYVRFYIVLRLGTGLIGLVKMRYLPSDDKLSLRGGTQRAAVDEYLEAELIPFYVRFDFASTNFLNSRTFSFIFIIIGYTTKQCILKFGVF